MMENNPNPGVSPALERITKVRLPFDMRSTESGKNYGIHGLDVWFILKGPKGAVQFVVTFPVYLPHVQAESYEWKYKPEIMGIDVGYHAFTPQYESQTSMPCDLLGGECYYDGSSLRADEWAKEIFAVRGEPPENEVWRRLEGEYVSCFGELTEAAGGERG